LLGVRSVGVIRHVVANRLLNTDKIKVEEVAGNTVSGMRRLDGLERETFMDEVSFESKNRERLIGSYFAKVWAFRSLHS